MNKGKKVLAVLSTAALFGTTPAAVVAPFLTATVAHAASSVDASNAPSVGTNTKANLGTVIVTLSAGTHVVTGDTVVINLPDEVAVQSPLNVTTDKGDNTEDPFNGSITPDLQVQRNLSIDNSQQSGNGRIIIKATQEAQLIDDYKIYIPLTNALVGSVADGPVDVTVQGSGAFPSGKVTVANVNTAGSVSLSALDTKSSNNSFDFYLDVKESIKGSFKVGNYIKLKLPAGFAWTENDGTTQVTARYGNDIEAKYEVDGDTLYIYNNGVYRSGNTIDRNSNAKTDTDSLWEIPLSFEVDDESVAKTGDVVATITGTATADTNQLVVGTYGEYGGQISVASTPELIAGKKSQQIGKITIKENVAGSFVKGRTITLELPEGARWESPFEGKDGQNEYTGSISTTNGLGPVKASYTGTDKRVLKLTLDNVSDNRSGSGGEVRLENMEVALQPGFSGDLTINVGGTEGVSGTITAAKVVAPVTVSAAEKPPVVTIGAGGQAIGDITLKENVAGGFAKTTVNGRTFNKVHLELPYGVQFDGTPTVEVTSGDLRIKDVTSGLGGDNKGYLDFSVDNESTTPSEITIKDAKLKLDRTVPEGDITLKVKGDAVAFTAYVTVGALEDSDDTSYAVPSWHDNYTTAAKTVVATVGTPAPGGTNVATFTVGSTTYTVNGVQQTMDVAPYLKNDGRVMLPVRFVANALGVSDDNIIWNQADKSVTIFKGNTVVKLTVGSNTLVVNGVAVTMDVAPELYNDGRVMLPLRWVGQALGAQLSWDQNTKTVTVTVQ